MRTHAAFRLITLAGLLAGCGMLVAGCATTDECCVADGIPRANCLVCKKNGDLACVCVRVTEHTPSCVLNGVTYYFCSDDCKRGFLKAPGRYLATGR